LPVLRYQGPFPDLSKHSFPTSSLAQNCAAYVPQWSTMTTHPCSSIDPDTYRTLLLSLYGAGLRISEALNLTLADVDLLAGTLHIRESKFYKTRMLPLGGDLLHLLELHVHKRQCEYAKPESPFFLSRRGGAATRQAAEITFKRLRRCAGVLRNHGKIRQQPKLHDFRHNSASRIIPSVAAVASNNTCNFND
jgi:integrase